MLNFSVENISVKLGAKLAVKGASFNARAGELICIVGPNGAGKSTLLRSLCCLLPKNSGTVRLDEIDVDIMTPIGRARCISYLPQDRALAWPLSVNDVVSLGRFAYGGAIGSLSEADKATVDDVISRCDLDEFKWRSVDSLSGGEKARVHCATTLAVNAEISLMDEPVAALDPKFQHEVMALLQKYTRSGLSGAHKSVRAKTIICVLHDLNLAAQYADRIIWMKSGEIIADGPPSETITAERVLDVFDVHATIDKNRDSRVTVYIEAQKA